jgi:uncharacterized protein
MIQRPQYLDAILSSFRSPIIKVITGMRRVGKSTIMLHLIDTLVLSGVDKDNIYYLDREDFRYERINNSDILFADIEKYFTTAKGVKYIFIDEIQDIAEWEKVIRHFGKIAEYEVCITGSNSHLLSSELGTYLSGRYIEFAVYPLSFKEFLSFKPSGSFREYMEFGWLPGVALLPDNLRTGYIDGVLNTVLVRDILERYNIRNGSLLSDILRYIASNIGYSTSTNKIALYLKKERISLAFETVREYISYFKSSFFLAAPTWVDILGKKHLDLHEKYYFTDIGIRNHLVGYRNEYIGQILENIVYNELITRWYTVQIGRIGDLEIDFIAERKWEKCYIQVAYLLASQETVDREFTPLKKIPDNYPKLVLSLDRDWGAGQDGIERKNIEDWLLNI